MSDDGLASRDLMIHHDRESPGRLCDYKQQLCIPWLVSRLMELAGCCSTKGSTFKFRDGSFASSCILELQTPILREEAEDGTMT